jgi:hypothetical protein
MLATESTRPCGANMADEPRLACWSAASFALAVPGAGACLRFLPELVDVGIERNREYACERRPSRAHDHPPWTPPRPRVSCTSLGRPTGLPTHAI